MKRYLHFNVWLAAVIMMICGTATMSAQTKVTSLDQLKAGSVIEIIPYYGFDSQAVACKGNYCTLAPYRKAGSGKLWTLEDAGDGYCYLKNDNGLYWTSENSNGVICSTSRESAVKICLTWDSKYKGVCFWNTQNGECLNDFNSQKTWFEWMQSPYYVQNYDENSFFHVNIVQEGSGKPINWEIKCIIDNGIQYLLHVKSKTAEVVMNGYRGDVVIPKSVTYDGIDYSVVSLGEACFCGCSGLTSITLPNSITSIGDFCFGDCSGLISITLPNSITSIGSYCFYLCI